jgi:aryl-alcohol dehydrogenase-like predicted oxidoreductase
VVNLGQVGLRVSKLGFGTFDFGVPSLKISPKMGAQILAESYRLGVTLWDTSDDYGSHPHIAQALKLVPREDVAISTKTSARDGKEAIKSLKHSLSELGTDYLDIFLLHYVRHEQMERARSILKELRSAKKLGLIKAVGLSTHSVTVTREAAHFEDADVIMSICCKANQATIDKFSEHVPLEDGSIDEMLRAVADAHNNGKGTIAIKVLGSSAAPLVRDYLRSISSIAHLESVDTLVIGMKSLNQVRRNLKAIQI